MSRRKEPKKKAAPKPIIKEPSTKGKVLVRLDSKTEVYLPEDYTEEDVQRMKEKYKIGISSWGSSSP